MHYKIHLNTILVGQKSLELIPSSERPYIQNAVWNSNLFGEKNIVESIDARKASYEIDEIQSNETISLKFEIKTNGDSGDTIFMYMNTAGTSGVDVDAHDVIRTTNDAPAGTLIRLVCVKGGAAEQWIAEVLQPSGSAATTEAAIG